MRLLFLFLIFSTNIAAGEPTTELTVAGALSRAQILATVAPHLSQVHACYEAVISKNPDLEGVLVERFTISPAGKVLSSVATEASTLHDSTVEDCVHYSVLSWVFAKSSDKTDVTYTFVLRQEDAGDLEISGPLKKSDARRVVDRRFGEIRGCYDRVWARHPKLRGKMKLQLVVSGDGKVTAAKIVENGIMNGEVDECILAAVRAWEFWMPDGQTASQVTYSFVLDRTPSIRQYTR